MANEIIQQLGASPESVIQQLRSSLTEIIAKAYRLKPTEELNHTIDELKELFYKLNYAMLTNDKTILSITGLQGVGKTKILRDLYQLDDEMLPSDGGRGEALPVLFTETAGQTTLSYFVRRAYRDQDGVYELKDVEISAQKLNAIAQNPDLDDLWLEVRVPQTYFNTEISLALLPGFEKNTKEISQRFLETLLKLSTSVLLVFNHRKLARQDQQVLLEKIATEYRDNAPVFALSFAEELNMEQREKLFNDLVTKFNIPESEKDRIVFTGTGDDFKDYPKQILAAISTYSLTNASGYRKQLRMLYSLSNEMIKLSSQLDTYINQLKTNELIIKYKNEENSNYADLNEIQEAFRQYRKMVTNDVKKVLHQNFQSHIKESTNAMNVALKNEKHNLWDKFKSAFNKDITFEEKLKFEYLIEELWNGETSIESERKLILSLDNYVNNEIHSIQSAKTTKRLGETVPSNPLLTPIALKEKVETDHKSEGIETALANIETYMNGDMKDLSIKLTKDDLKVLPIIAVGIAQELVAASLIIDQDHFANLDSTTQKEILDKSNSLVGEFQDLALSTSTVVKGTALFFGIDALDGTFNTFGALTSILTTVGIPASAAGPVGLLIVGTIGSGLAIHKGAQRIEKYKFDRSSMANAVFTNIAQSQEESVTATINNILDKMEDKLIDTYHRRRGTDKNFGLFDELDNRINRLQQQCGELQELAFRNETYIG